MQNFVGNPAAYSLYYGLLHLLTQYHIEEYKNNINKLKLFCHFNNNQSVFSQP